MQNKAVRIGIHQEHVLVPENTTEAFYGTKNTVEVPHSYECGTCHGSGSQPGSIRNCPACKAEPSRL